MRGFNESHGLISCWSRQHRTMWYHMTAVPAAASCQNAAPDTHARPARTHARRLRKETARYMTAAHRRGVTATTAAVPYTAQQPDRSPQHSRHPLMDSSTRTISKYDGGKLWYVFTSSVAEEDGCGAVFIKHRTKRSRHPPVFNSHKSTFVLHTIWCVCS